MASAGNGKPKNLGRTLQDLEAAFADWEKLSDAPVAPTEKQIDPELRKKTKKLLEELREQLSDLAD